MFQLVYVPCCFSQAAAVPEEEDDPYPTEEDISGWFERNMKPLYTDDSSPTINQVLDHAQIQFEMEFHAGMTDEERAVSDILHRLHRAAGEREDQARV